MKMLELSTWAHKIYTTHWRSLIGSGLLIIDSRQQVHIFILIYWISEHFSGPMHNDHKTVSYLRNITRPVLIKLTWSISYNVFRKIIESFHNIHLENQSNIYYISNTFFKWGTIFACMVRIFFINKSHWFFCFRWKQ